MKNSIKKIFFPCNENNYFPLFLHQKFLNLYFILLLFLKIFTLPLLFSISKTFLFADITRTALLEYLNQARKNSGLTPLVENPKLEQSALLKAKDILEKDYFAHWTPDGKSPWYWFNLANYNFSYAGENLAIGFLDSKEVFDAWMNSFSHRANILNPNYKEIGISILKGDFKGNEVYVVVQHFGTPKTEVKTERKLPPSSVQISQKKVTPSLVPSIATQTLPAVTPTETTISENTNSKEEIKNKETPASSLTNVQPFSQNKGILFKTIYFLATRYSSILNGLVYFSLIFLIFSLILTIFCDIFIYRKYVIDYRELMPRTVIFFVLLVLFIYLDQPKILKLISHNLLIYGI